MCSSLNMESVWEGTGCSTPFLNKSMQRTLTPGIMYSSILISLLICYNAIWKFIPELCTGYNIFYNRVFPDMGAYYSLVIAAGMMLVLMSGILLVGLTVKIGQLLGDVFL